MVTVMLFDRNAEAIARPIPRDPPVTIATLAEACEEGMTPIFIHYSCCARLCFAPAPSPKH